MLAAGMGWPLSEMAVLADQWGMRSLRVKVVGFWGVSFKITWPARGYSVVCSILMEVAAMGAVMVDGPYQLRTRDLPSGSLIRAQSEIIPKPRAALTLQQLSCSLPGR